jgi:hypothetical protein
VRVRRAAGIVWRVEGSGCGGTRNGWQSEVASQGTRERWRGRGAVEARIARPSGRERRLRSGRARGLRWAGGRISRLVGGRADLAGHGWWAGGRIATVEACTERSRRGGWMVDERAARSRRFCGGRADRAVAACTGEEEGGQGGRRKGPPPSCAILPRGHDLEIVGGGGGGRPRSSNRQCLLLDQPLSRLLRLKPLPNSASCCASAAANRRPTGAAPPWPAPAPSWAAEPLRTLPTPRARI